jgi:hypothetical protein
VTYLVLEHVEQRGLAGVVEAKEEDLGLLLPQAEGGQHPVEPVPQEHLPTPALLLLPPPPPGASTPAFLAPPQEGGGGDHRDLGVGGGRGNRGRGGRGCVLFGWRWPLGRKGSGALRQLTAGAGAGWA